jgi:excisionase family DNA binding protein
MTTLLTLKEAAARLKCTTDQVLGLVDDGELKYINVGRGKVKPRYRFAETDIDDFLDRRRTREEPKECLFTREKVRRITNSIAGSKVIGLEALRKQRTSAKLRE